MHSATDRVHLDLKLAEPGGCEKYQRENKIDLCRRIAEVVMDPVRKGL